MSYGRMKFASKNIHSYSLEEYFKLYDYAFTKAHDNGGKVSLNTLENKMSSWHDGDVLYAMRKRLGKELFKEVIGETGIYYRVNPKYLYSQPSYMHDYIKLQVYSKRLWE